MFLLKLGLSIIGLIIIILAIICFLSSLTQELGFIAGMIGAALVFFIFKNDSFVEFLGVSTGLIDDIGFGAMIGGGILCSMEFEKIGGVMITAGWIAVGLILMQAIPIPFIANMIEVVTLPFTVACVPLLLLILFVISFF